MQSKKGSFIEAISNTIIGYVITLIFSPFLYGICGIEYRTSQLCIVTLLFTILSICRGYVIRRWFNKKQEKKIYSEAELREKALKFFYHWYNAPGANTEQGFDEWIKTNK